MARKTANIRWFCFDWKEHVKGSDLAKAIKEVEKFGYGSKVIENAVNTGSDSYVTLVVPEYYNLDTLGEDVDNILAFADAMHITKDGGLWFKFDAQCGMPAAGWLSQKDSVCWVEGIQASDELSPSNPYKPHKSEVAELKKAKAKALKLVNK